MKQTRILLILVMGTSLLFSAYRQKNEFEKTQFVSTKVNESTGNLSGEEKVTVLKEKRKIENRFNNGADDKFENITSICVDVDNNLYVADSGVHKLFKFNDQGKYLYSFGKSGQGPKEFIGSLRISIGNDARLYITDDENWRLSVYDLEGRFIKEFPISKYIYDVAIANTSGEIFLLSPSGTSLVDCYDNRMSLKESLIEYSGHLKFPYHIPSEKAIKAMYKPSIINIKKMITKKDVLIIISNNSLCAWILDNNHNIVKEFKIAHPKFIDNYRKRINELNSKGKWLDCFGSAFLDNNEDICLCYYNTDIEQPEIYRYDKNGEFLNVIRIDVADNKIVSNRAIDACDRNGNMYAINTQLQNIVIYQEKENK